MLVWWIIVVLLVPIVNPKCFPNKIDLWSPTKCQAGRRFFARLDFPGAKGLQPYLFPWLAEIQIFYGQNVSICTGALINDRYVLTVQHCVPTNLQSNRIMVHLGFFNGYKTDETELFQSRTQDRAVLHIIRHPNYNPQDPRTFANALALLRTEPIEYSKTIFPIQLPSAGDHVLDLSNQIAENVAWSFFYQNGKPLMKKLKQNDVRILNDRCCRSYNNNQNGLLCSVTVEDGIAPRRYEQGSLLMLDKIEEVHNITVLTGIAVWEHKTRKPCGQTAGQPTVYVRIDNKLQWIAENTSDGLYCQY